MKTRDAPASPARPGRRTMAAITILLLGGALALIAHQDTLGASESGPRSVGGTAAAGTAVGHPGATGTSMPCDGAAPESIAVNAARSTLRWRGTKFRGRGSHEGTVPVATGTVVRCAAEVRDGWFTIDMRHIQVTDMPTHEREARRNLTQHLESEDFFWVARYPVATFRLSRVQPVGNDSVRVTGALTLRGVTRPVAFRARVQPRAADVGVLARITLDRQAWGVAFRFDPLRNLLVDDDITLDLALSLPPAAAQWRASARHR